VLEEKRRHKPAPGWEERMIWSRKRENPLAGRDMMQLVPAPLVEHQVGDDDLVTLLVPRFRSGLTRRWLQPRLPEGRRYVHVALEARGSVLWREMDGERRVHALVAAFEAAFPDDNDDSIDRVCRWLMAMYSNDFVQFVGIESETAR
jgi:hypothetical protein